MWCWHRLGNGKDILVFSSEAKLFWVLTPTREYVCRTWRFCPQLYSPKFSNWQILYPLYWQKNSSVLPPCLFCGFTSKVLWIISGMCIIQSGHSDGPLWLQLRVTPVGEHWLWCASSLRHWSCSPSGPNTVLLCCARPLALACWPLMIAVCLSLTRSLFLPPSHGELQRFY